MFSIGKKHSIALPIGCGDGLKLILYSPIMANCEIDKRLQSTNVKVSSSDRRVWVVIARVAKELKWEALTMKKVTG